MKAIVCKNCVYFNSSITNEETGYCHRYPPTKSQVFVHGVAVCTHPQVSFDDWCGEYKEKINDGDRGQIPRDADSSQKEDDDSQETDSDIPF